MLINTKESGSTAAGTATKDAEYKEIGNNGTPLASFSLAVNRFGANVPAIYLDCKAFGATLANRAIQIKKGDMVRVDGFIEEREHNEKTYKSLNCQFVDILPKLTAMQNVPQSAPVDDFTDMDLSDDLLPF